MQSTWHPAPSSLAGILAGIWSVHADQHTDLAARVLPDNSTSLVFQRVHAALVSCAENRVRHWAPVAVSGPRTGAFEFTLRAGGSMMIVELHPAGAHAVLGVPMKSLTDRGEALSDVIGPVPGALVDTVCSGTDDVTAIQAIESWLLERVRKHQRVCAATSLVVDEVIRTAGGIRVDDLAARVRVSRRHLGRLMQQQLGISPKLFARIVRFDRAVELGRFASHLTLARIAVEAGYADQAHMNREFVDLGGIRPSDLRSDAGAMIW
ncbi:MAG: helix-turn-helix domain-containing protein [Planctomycetota bacterium]